MKFDVNKIIAESIAETVVSEADQNDKELVIDASKKVWNQIQDDMSRGRAAEEVFDAKERLKKKIFGDATDEKFELAKKLARANARAAKAENMGIGEHLTKAGEKAVATVKGKTEEIKNAIADHPGAATAVAGAIAAGLGALALRKRLKKLPSNKL